MRKPLIALSLAVGASLGAVPAAQSFAAGPESTPSQISSPVTPLSSSPSPAANAVSGAQIVATALKYLGYPYTTVGNSPSTGFSCIGFASFVYRSNGIPLPGDLQDAWNYAPQVPFADLLPGDLLYFANTVWPGLSHVAIYLGGGRFVHAEYYGLGVRISQFTNDSRDGNYWTEHYMGANRPWNGPVQPVVVPTDPSSHAPSAPSSQASTQSVTGPTSTIVVAVNVRQHPRTDASVKEVASAGTQVVIIGKSHGWYKVQLPDGRVGWIIGEALGQASTTATSNIGTPTAPTRQGQPTAQRTTVSQRTTTVTVHANGLRVHSSPSTGATVVTSLNSGQKLTVIGQKGGWLEVRLPDGSVGWIDSSYGTVHRPSRVSHPSRPVNSKTAGVNVRVGPSTGYAIVTTLTPGTSYRILGYRYGWAHIRLSDGRTGWVLGSLIGASGPTYHSVTSSRPAKPAVSSLTHRITAGVRVHVGPAVKDTVITVAGAGTKCAILGYSHGWAHVRLSTGTIGWVLGTYVR